MIKITIDFSKCRLHKETDKGFMITGSKPRSYKGSMGTSMCFLPYKVTEVVSHKKNEIDSTTELILKIPRWIFLKQIEGKEDIVSRIKIIDYEESK